MNTIFVDYFVVESTIITLQQVNADLLHLCNPDNITQRSFFYLYQNPGASLIMFLPTCFLLLSDLKGLVTTTGTSMLTVALTETLWSPLTLDAGVWYVLSQGSNRCSQLTYNLSMNLLCKQPS